MGALTVSQRIQKAHFSVMGHRNFKLLSSVLLIGDVVILKKGDERYSTVKTAATNGKDVWYNYDYVHSLTDAELYFLVIHENLHKAFKHLIIWRDLFKLDAAIANMALDYVINYLIVHWEQAVSVHERLGVQMPKGGMYDKRFKDDNPKKVFDILWEEREQGKNQEGVGEAMQGFDDHLWEEADALSESEQTDLQKTMDDALRQGIYLAGKQGCTVVQDVNKLLASKVDWVNVLYQFVNNIKAGYTNVTFSRPNRRFIAQDIYMPSSYDDSVRALGVFSDISASVTCDKTLLTQFVTEIKKIATDMKPEKLHVAYWDSEVERVEAYTDGEYDELESLTKPSGGGGTDPRCVTSYIKNGTVDYDAIIMLTDGYVSNWGDWEGINTPVLWMVVGSDKKPSHGTVVNIKN